VSGHHAEPCQVDFFLLGEPAAKASNLACRLALMAWERKQKVFIATNTPAASEALDELMWQFPDERFLPHAVAGISGAEKAPILIGQISGLKPVDVVINLCPEAVPEPSRFDRILEIVPFDETERKASREKYITYRKLGLSPETHEIRN
jgi:DNA polymerase-3 subunit chi